MVISAEGLPRVERVEERGDKMSPAAIVKAITPVTETQAAGTTPPDLKLFYIPGLPVLTSTVTSMVGKVVDWFGRITEKNSPSDYNPLD